MTTRQPPNVDPTFRDPRRSRRQLAAALVVALAPLAPSAVPAQQPVRAAAPSTDTIPLSLGEALDRATGQSEEIRLARSQVDLAEAQVTTARSAALPQLNASINYTRTFASPFSTGGGFTLPDSLRFDPDSTASLAERVSYLERRVPSAGLAGLGSLFGNLPFGQKNAYTAALTGSQLLYSGGRVGAALNIASSFEEVARLGLREETANVSQQVQTAYYRAALAEELERIATEALAQAERFLADVRLRLEAGTASELEVLRADVEQENLRPQLVAAQNAAQLARLDLKRLVNIPLDQPVRLTTALTPPPPAELAEPGLEPAADIERRAALAAAEQQVEIAAEQVRIARGAYLPQVSLSMNYGGQLFPGGPFDLSGDWRRDWNATVGVQIPIFSGFQRQGELAQARVGLEQRRLQLAQLQEGVRLEYEQALGERERARTAIAARQRTVEQAQRVHDLTVLRYEQGLATQLEVSDARLALLQSRTNVAQAIADYRIADLGVARAIGSETLTSPRPAARDVPRNTPPPATPPTVPPSTPPTNDRR
ncbi:MAG TPA: TolC family protein [Gemmatimonadales bacterium]